ncbi:hypothetical protein OK351_17070 [Glutamicibacter sp. MNS18]|uniref:hypothetical protein n=1 Tax=Glutamicibacter sp. MNS18 TaxID=2989817 RepID=UPI00223588D7|nr:hypothetical protein [Glutamicibacter sp. MNS18]MCW4467194.1 hypothetical protein [Glutamicibacter sp. MNS18]
MKKPGNDVLVWFWIAVALPVVAAIIQTIENQRIFEGDVARNILNLTPLLTVAVGLYLLAGIFWIVVIHKALSMLRYLVHSR